MDFGVPGCSQGAYKGLPSYEQRLWEIPHGKRTTLVAKVIIWSPQGKGHLCKSLIYNQFFRYNGAVPNGYEKVSFVNALVHHGLGPTLVVDDASAVLSHPPREANDFFDMVELCTGLGALGCGASYAGWKTSAQNELQPAFCQHLQQYGNTVVIEGDLCKLSTLVKIHEAAPRAAAIAWGFSCQPFSKLGDQLHGNDARAQTLPYGLFASYLLQKELIVLECVTGAATSGFVQKCLEYHISMTKYERSETMMDLGDLWPAARKRWWCVLMHGSFGKITFRQFPEISPKPTIHNLLPGWLKLTEKHVAELRLSEQEHAMFNSCKPGLVQQIVDSHSQLSTALHSWGNQCQPCKCGCRPAFTDGRLRDQGLYGALVVIENEVGPHNIRHLSPQEVALLCGWPKKTGWEDDQRLLLAGIGQLASPIQSAWVFGHIREHLATYGYGNITPALPSQIMACVCMDVFQIRDELYPPKGDTVANAVFREEIENMLEPLKSPMPAICDMVVEEDGQVVHAQGEFQSSNQGFVAAGDSQPKSPGQDSLDNAIIETLTVETTKKRRSILGAVPGFIRHDLESQESESATNTTQEATTQEAEFKNLGPGDSHVLDRWCMNWGPGGLDEAQQTEGSDQVNKHGLAEVQELTGHAHWTDSAELRQGCGITPWDLTEGKSVVFHRESCTMYAVTVGKHQKIQDLMTATGKLSGNHAEVCFDMLGYQMNPETPIEEGMVVCIGQHSDTASDVTATEEVEAKVSKMPRWCSLLFQGGRVAHDEMSFYMQAVSHQSQVAMVYPLLLDALSTEQIEEWKHEIAKTKQTTISIILTGHHWTPIVVEVDGDSRKIISPSNKASLISCIFGPGEHVEGLSMPVQFQHDCGFQAFTWMIATLGSQKEVHVLSQSQATKWRMLYWQRLYMDPQANQAKVILLGGHEEELVTAVSAMLKEHGVSTDQVYQRAKGFISKVGAQEVHAAVVSSRPWQAIKRLANECKPAFRLVLQQELDQVLADKAKDGKPIGNRKNKATSSGEQHAITLGPENVVIPKGVFSQQDGVHLQQLAVRQVSSKSAGIVVVSEAEVQPFLNTAQISEEGLAFLVLHPSVQVQQHVGTLERFPAQCSASGEPILVSAFMLQRGGKTVVRSKPQQILKIEEVPVTTVKLLVFRDQLQQSWSEFCEAPVKHALKLAPCLQVCKVSPCECEAWHHDPNKGEAPVLDIWNRDFLNYNFKKTNQKEAVLFACAARINTAVFDKLCTYSGSGGLYVEPRSSDGRSFHPGYHTVWLSKMSHQEALAARATTDAKAILVRVQHRFGLKVSQEQAAQVHSQFHGDAVFLSGSQKVLYTVGPMPWGASRAALVALFKTWDWPAKPIQAIGKSADQRGLMWSVQALQAPPASVVTMEHGDVLLVRKEPEVAAVQKPPSIEASLFTKKSLQPNGVLPPLRSDPWEAEAKKMQAGSTAIAAPSQHQIAQMEKQVEQRVLDKLQSQDRDEDMNGVVDQRIQDLESKVQQLHDAQQQQQAQTASLSHQVSQVQGKFEKYLDGKLAEQMSQIEALLNKRSRHE